MVVEPGQGRLHLRCEAGCGRLDDQRRQDASGIAARRDAGAAGLAPQLVLLLEEGGEDLVAPGECKELAVAVHDLADQLQCLG